jgi:hypothetical protein
MISTCWTLGSLLELEYRHLRLRPRAEGSLPAKLSTLARPAATWHRSLTALLANEIPGHH